MCLFHDIILYYSLVRFGLIVVIINFYHALVVIWYSL